MQQGERFRFSPNAVYLRPEPASAPGRNERPTTDRPRLPPLVRSERERRLCSDPCYHAKGESASRRATLEPSIQRALIMSKVLTRTAEMARENLRDHEGVRCVRHCGSVAEPTEAQVRQLNRLLDEENRERDERRGLENRMTGLTASSLVALGLIANAAATGHVKNSIATVLLLLAGLLVVLGLLRITGWQRKPESFAKWRKNQLPHNDDRYPLNMPQLAEDNPQSALAEQLLVIRFLREQNKRRLRIHMAGQMFFLAVAVTFIGVLAFLIR